MNADGSGVTQLTNNSAADFEPDWSPDSIRITWRTTQFGDAGEVAVMNADGSGVVNLTNDLLVYDLQPAWAPDGTKIAYASYQTDGEIMVMNADGTGKAALTSNNANDYDPDWQPAGQTPPPATATLTVTKAGSGTGMVKSRPAGILCGTDCSQSYTSGTVVTLRATPAAGSTFTGWSGACTGSGMCTVTMNESKAVTATFTPG